MRALRYKNQFESTAIDAVVVAFVVVAPVYTIVASYNTWEENSYKP